MSPNVQITPAGGGSSTSSLKKKSDHQFQRRPPQKFGRDRDSIGKTVRITQGPYKGHIGIVKDATPSTARVELHSQCQTISVDRARVMFIDDNTQDKTKSAAAASENPLLAKTSFHTPVYGSQTPMYSASHTPMHDSGNRTPCGVGSNTPRSTDGGGLTPGNVWDPMIPMTPRSVDIDRNSSGPYSPMYHPPKTPAGIIPGTSEISSSPQLSEGGSLISKFNYSVSPHSMAPLTPGLTPYTPQTPGSSFDLSSDWQMDGLFTRIKHSENSELNDQVGVIKSVHGKLCSVYLQNANKVVSIIGRLLCPVNPSVSDKVMILSGESRGSIGELLSIDACEGVVKLADRSSNEDIQMFQLSLLCKYKG
ncbi:hypothetical protein GJ496_004273 [Pomphorhynchus laevis]|nr:hypothetical protein GJ496_004273 [Pomphorhynchus laevis]